MISVTSALSWFGDRITDAVFGDVDVRLRRGGEAWKAVTHALAPKRTSFLVSQEDYEVHDRTLILKLGAFYDIYQEFGTRFIPPHPHARPGLAAIGRIFGGDIEMHFNTMASGAWTGIFAHQGGFVVPSGIQPRPLTQAQHRHVREKLLPVSRRLYRGNVRRAKMVVRRFD